MGITKSNKKFDIIVNYEDTEIAKGLESIIKSPHKKEFIKLLTPLICSESNAVKYFMKIFAGYEFGAVIPEGSLAYIKVKNLGWSADEDQLRENGLVREDDTVLVKVIAHLGFHSDYDYEVSFPTAKADSNNKVPRKNTAVRGGNLILFKDF